MAKFFEWTKELSVGEDTIDTQHQKLLAQVNNIINALVNGITSREVADALHFFEEYIHDHLIYEEEYMRKINYPDLETHISQHQNFIENYNKFKGKLKSDINLETLALDIEKFIGDWWLNHIGVSDQKYKRSE